MRKHVNITPAAAFVVVTFFVFLMLQLNLSAGEIVENKNYAGEKITIRFAQYGEAGEIEYLKLIFTDFVGEHPNIKIDFSVYPWGQYWPKLQVQSASGLAPDVMMLYSGIIGVWVARGAIMPLDEFLENSRISLEDYHKVALENCRWRGSIYSFPLDIPVRTLIYKTDKLEQSGIPRSAWPKPGNAMSWDEFKELARRLTIRNPDGSFKQYGMVGGLAWNDIMFGMYGGSFFDRQVDPTEPTVLDNEELIKGIVDVFKLQYSDRLHLGDVPLRSSSMNVSSLLYNNQFAMGIDGPWALRNLENDGIRYGLTPLPRGKFPAQLLDVNAVAIYSGSKNPREAWQLIQYLASENVQSLFGRRLRGVPSLIAAKASLINNDYNAADCEAFIADLPFATPNVISESSYITRVVDMWRISTETVLANEYDRRLRMLNRVNGAIPDDIYAGFVSYMDSFIEKTVGAQIAVLDRDIRDAFEKSRPVESGITVKYILPFAALLLIFVFIWLYYKFIRKAGGEKSIPFKSVKYAGYFIISPWITGFAFFIIGPIAAAVILSFTDWNLVSSPNWVGFENYLRIFRDSTFYLGLERTFTYTLLVIPISFFGGIFTAGLLTYNIRGTDFFKAVFYFPSLFTGAAAAVLYLNMFNKEYGIINHFLSLAGIAPINWLDESHAFYTVVLMNIFWIGSAMIIYYAGMKQIPKELYEAAEVDGAGYLQKFFAITIPQLAPVIVFMVVITTIAAFQVFTPALFFAQNAAEIGEPGNSLRFYSVNIYDEAFNKLNMGLACTYALILFLVIFLITMLQIKFSKRFVHTA